jgi:hypothetical protein
MPPVLQSILRIFGIGCFVLAAVGFGFVHTPAALVGFLITLPVIAGCFLLAAATPMYVLGLLLFLSAIGITVAIASPPPGWPRDPTDLAVLAVTTGIAALGFVGWDSRSGGPRPSVERWAGRAGVAGLLLFAGVVALVPAERLGASIIVASEALYALSELAGTAWRSKLALASVPVFCALLAAYLRPSWTHDIVPVVGNALRVVFAPANLPFPACALLWTFICIRERAGWRPTLTGLAFIMGVVYLIRWFWIAVGVVHP